MAAVQAMECRPTQRYRPPKFGAAAIAAAAILQPKQDDSGEPPAKRRRIQPKQNQDHFEAAGPRMANPDPQTFANPSNIPNTLAILQRGVNNVLRQTGNPSLPIRGLPPASRVGMGTPTVANVIVKTIIIAAPILAEHRGYVLLDAAKTGLRRDEPYFHVRFDTGEKLVEAARAHKDTPFCYAIVSFTEYFWWINHGREMMQQFPELIGIRENKKKVREAVFGDGRKKNLDPNVRSSYSRPFFDFLRFSGIILADMNFSKHDFAPSVKGKPINGNPFPAYTGGISGKAEVRNIWSPHLMPEMRIGFEEILDLRKCSTTYRAYSGLAGGSVTALAMLAIVEGNCFELLRTEYRNYLLHVPPARTVTDIQADLTKLREDTLSRPIERWLQMETAVLIASGTTKPLFEDVPALGTPLQYISEIWRRLRRSDKALQRYRRELRNPRGGDSRNPLSDDVVDIRMTFAQNILDFGKETANVFPTEQDLQRLREEVEGYNVAGESLGREILATQTIADFYRNGPRRRSLYYPKESVYGVNNPGIIYGRRQYIGVVLTLQPDYMFQYDGETRRVTAVDGYSLGAPTPYPQRVHLHLCPTEPMTMADRMGG